MDIAYPNIAERLFGRPHAIDPVALRAIMDGPLARRVLNGERFEKRKTKKSRDIRKDRLAAIANAEVVRSEDGIVDYALTAEGVAIIPVMGVLSRRFDWLAAACGWTTYEGLGATLEKALANGRTKAVLFDVDSPGGEADGMLDIADDILSARDTSGKPVWAVANTLAASAAYAIAGSAEKLFLPRLAVVGSIGCVTIHVDQSRMDKAEGLAYTAIYSGARKIDGWGHAPLSDGARESTQEAVDYVRGQFAELVGRQGRMSISDALATEAAVYTDEQAVEAKLANGVATFAEVLADLTTEIVPTFKGAFTMGKNANSSAAAELPAEGSAAIAASVEGTAPTAETAPPAPPLAPVHAEMTPPAPGEKCQLCGQMMDDPEDDEDDDAPDKNAGAATVEPVANALYGQAEIEETISLCAIAGAKADVAQKFISAKTAIAKVREALTEARAASSDRHQITPSSIVGVDGVSAVSNEERMKSWRETQAKIRSEMGISPRAA